MGVARRAGGADRTLLTLTPELILVVLARFDASKPVSEPTGYFQQKILEYEEQKKQKKSREKTVK